MGDCFLDDPIVKKYCKNHRKYKTHTIQLKNLINTVCVCTQQDRNTGRRGGKGSRRGKQLKRGNKEKGLGWLKKDEGR